MTAGKANITVNVDVTNPGQFFACCGLLELAHRIDQSATAFFEPGFFLIDADVPKILDAFFKCDVTVETTAAADDDEGDDEPNVDAHRGRTYPMILGEPFGLRLDWWRDDAAQCAKTKDLDGRPTRYRFAQGTPQGKKTCAHFPRCASILRRWLPSTRRTGFAKLCLLNRPILMALTVA